MPLQDVALDEREHAYYGPRMGDWLLLGFVVIGLLANGLYVWHQLGPAHDHVGRAIFFGLAVLAAFWATLVFTFKLSVCVRVGTQGMSIVRGPWHTELAWAQVSRLVERVQVVNQRRLRWVVAVARDGRSLQVREDMVTDYGAFRVEMWERFRLWRDHGGTWGTTGGGPFAVRETASTQTAWWMTLGVAALLPGLYFTLILTELGIVGPILVAVAAMCGVFGLRAVLRRRMYAVDAKGIQCKQFLRTTRLAWRDVKKVERTRRSFGGATELSIILGRAMLRLAARGDGRVESFDWSPRVPEYLILRGAGRQVRIRLHRLARPDEMLAWVEFYERAGRHLADMRDARRTIPPAAKMATGAPAARSAPDLARTTTTSRPVSDAAKAGTSGPADPWATGRDGTPEPAREGRAAASGAASASASGTTGRLAEPSPEGPSGESSGAWLRAETSSAWHPGMRQATAPASGFEMRPGDSVGAHVDAPDTDAGAVAGTRPDAWSGGGDRLRAEPAARQKREETPEPQLDRWTPPDWLDRPDQATEPALPAQTLYPAPPSPPAEPPYPAQPAWQMPDARSVSEQTWRPSSQELASGVADKVPAEAGEDVPTDSGEPLADAFRLWGQQTAGERPQFPRFGPPLNEESSSAPDAQQLDRDDFLR